MVTIIANGAAGNETVTKQGDDFDIFCSALAYITDKMCRAMAKDGEGATKLLECVVTGAATKKDAKLAAKAVISSSLVKTAMFGADANWGRELCAIGYSGADFNPESVDVSFSSAAGDIAVCEGGFGIDFSEEKAKKVLSEDEITININLHCGSAKAVAYGCDLTYDYVKINGDYRT
jgi:glutamate N-acetyltransferase/amino-acid N-acetyltransferase